MKKQKVHPLDRFGQWNTMDIGYFDGAIRFLEEAREFESTINLKIQKLEKECSDYNEEDRDSYIYHLTYDDRRNLAQQCVVAMLFSCMAVESFINLYGVLRMGGEFYKRNIERVGISQKLEIIIAVGTQQLMSKNEEIALLIRRMFDKRNQLVHPKTSEVDSPVQMAQLRPIHHLDEAQSMVDDMKKFFEYFLLIDPDSRMWTPEKKGFVTKDS